MHWTLALYRLGFQAYLEPIAQALEYTHLTQDFQLNKWSKHDQFLLLFGTASIQWLKRKSLEKMVMHATNMLIGIMPQAMENKSFSDILREVRKNKTV